MLNKDDLNELQHVTMTSTLHALAQEFDDEQREYVGHALLDMLAQMQKWQADGSAPVDCSAGLHSSVDGYIKEQQKPGTISDQITCGPGCGSCCHIAVAVTSCEAEQLLEAAEQNGIALDMDKLKRQANQTDETWLSLSATDKRCVFLGQDNRCRVYSERPLSCRKYFSIDDPMFCDIERYPKRQVRIWYDLHVEILSSAAMTQFGVGNLPDMLLAAIEAADHHPTQED